MNIQESTNTNSNPNNTHIINGCNYVEDISLANKSGNDLEKLQQLTGLDFIDVINPQELLQIFENATLQGLIQQDENGELKCYIKPGIESRLNLRQYLQVRTQDFSNRFGDRQHHPETASKVVDEYGEPLVLYHRTNMNFTYFNQNLIGSQYGSDLGWGFYFSRLKDDEEGSEQMECFIKIKKPQQIAKDVKYFPYLKFLGHPLGKDGAISQLRQSVEHMKTVISNKDLSTNYRVIPSEQELAALFEGEYDGRMLDKWIIVFGEHANQIKSATGNHGAFSDKTHNIYD